MIFSALISHQVEQRKKLERRMQVTKTELGSLSRNADSIAQLLEARTKFIQTGVVDVSTKLLIDFFVVHFAGVWLKHKLFILI